MILIYLLIKLISWQHSSAFTPGCSSDGSWASSRLRERQHYQCQSEAAQLILLLSKVSLESSRSS